MAKAPFLSPLAQPSLGDRKGQMTAWSADGDILDVAAISRQSFSLNIYRKKMGASEQNEFSSRANADGCAWSSLVLVLLTNVVDEFQ